MLINYKKNFLKYNEDYICPQQRANKSITELGRVRQDIYKSEEELQDQTDDKLNMSRNSPLPENKHKQIKLNTKPAKTEFNIICFPQMNVLFSIISNVLD